MPLGDDERVRLPFFRGDLLHPFEFKVPFRKDLLLPRILTFLQESQLHIIGGHAGKPLAPRIDCLFAESMRLGNLRFCPKSIGQPFHNFKVPDGQLKSI